MLFTITDIREQSRNFVCFVLQSTDMASVTLNTREYALFRPTRQYRVEVSRQLICTSPPVLFVHYGVVIRKTRNTVRVASGSNLWTMPSLLCPHPPGSDVCVIVT